MRSESENEQREKDKVCTMSIRIWFHRCRKWSWRVSSSHPNHARLHGRREEEIIVLLCVQAYRAAVCWYALCGSWSYERYCSLIMGVMLRCCDRWLGAALEIRP